jgi:steroid delta-isomerase-like uncharacterized protein
MNRMSVSMLLAALLLTAGVAQQKQHAAVNTNPVAQSWIEGWNSHDVNKLAAAFTDDVMYEDVPYGEVNHGTAELKKFATSELEAVPDLKLELVRSSIQGNQGAIEWMFTGTDKGIYKTGKKFTVRGVSLIHVKNGKISSSRDYYDAASIMKDVGVLPKQ